LLGLMLHQCRVSHHWAVLRLSFTLIHLDVLTYQDVTRETKFLWL
jgi:hypothetical protein